jgi:iron only hydrogenase large subunit-like protein
MAPTDTYFRHSLKVNDYLCAGCTTCMRICPTAAIRIRGGKAVISDNKCVDCGECLKSCPRKAIYIKQDDFNLIENYGCRVALVPAVFIGQFEEKYKTKDIYACLKRLGFTHIYEVEHSVEFLVALYKEYMAAHPEIRTFISPYCPAVIRLVQVRYPSLVDNIIKLKSPLDVAARAILKKLEDQGIRREAIGIFYVTPCAAKIASVKYPVSNQDTHIAGVINMDFLYNKVKLMLSNSDKDAEAINHTLTPADVMWPLSRGEAANFPGSPYAVDGLQNVIQFLDRLEDDAVDAPGLVELRVCDEGCVGGVLTTQNCFVARKRMENRAKLLARLHHDQQELTYDHTEFSEQIAEQMVIPEIKPRSLYKLDENFGTAFKMAEQMKKIEKALPGINCSACGAPSCAALAEDIVRGDAVLDSCIFINRHSAASEAAIKRVWGDRVQHADSPSETQPETK